MADQLKNSKNPRSKEYRTAILIRTNYFDSDIYAMYRKYEQESSFSVYIAADERQNVLKTPDDVKKIVIDLEFMRSGGYYLSDDALWRCGDYCLYEAARLLPDFDYFWLIEPDVIIKMSDCTVFFSLFEQFSDVDFFSCKFGRSSPTWYWYESIASHVASVYNCMFPITRTSRSAINFLSQRRRSLSEIYRVAKGKKMSNVSDLWPNDEAFVASMLVNNGYKCVDINQVGHVLYNNQSFTFNRPLSFAHITESEDDGLIYHPVLIKQMFKNKIYRLFQSCQYNNYTPDMLKSLFDKRMLSDLEIECGTDVRDEFNDKLQRVISAGNTTAGQRPTNVSSQDGCLVVAQFRSKNINFFIENKDDYIQRFHMRGAFYEDVELSFMEKYLKPEMTYCDIGAHVGNHVLFVGLYLKPRLIIPIEPVQTSSKILKCNVHINGLTSVVNFDYLPYALSDVSGLGLISVDTKNTGAASLKYVAGSVPFESSVNIVTGDEILLGTSVDFIKIDVGGQMEREVLLGLSGVLKTNKPLVVVHVSDNQRQSIFSFMENMQFMAIEAYKRYDNSETVLFQPKENATPHDE